MTVSFLLFVQAAPVFWLRRCCLFPFSSAPAVSAAFLSSSRRTIATLTTRHNNPLQNARFVSIAAAATTKASSTDISIENTSATSTMKKPSSSEQQLPLFADLPNLHPLSKKALASMGLTRMTEIQAKTWEAAVEGRDVLGRARTGTGKTIAFLLPAIERLLMNHKMVNGRNEKATAAAAAAASVDMLVLSPTRELAAQIADQAGQLMQYTTSPAMSVQIMFGGTNRNQDLVKLERKIPTILVSTPGRLKDHLENHSMVRSKAFSTLFRNTRVLVLDETDRLLDMGFSKDVQTIISFLPPKQQRQTLLFSATLPQEVKQVLQATMNTDYVAVDCIHTNSNNSENGEGTMEHTNAQVLQSHVMLRSDTNLVTGTVDILLKLLQNNNNKNSMNDDDDDDAVKMVVFFSTAKMVAYYASLFNDELKVPVWEIHSRKSQSYRTTASNKFREAHSGVLFTSDVSARGVDYPDVTHVVQFGMADSRESYIHRLGRTGRAGKQGEGLLVLSEPEKGFLKQLADIDIPRNQDMQDLVDSSSSSISQTRLQPIFNSMKNGKNKELVNMAESAYRAMLGFYNGKLKRIGGGSTEDLVNFANGWALQSGLKEVPGFELKTIRKMGLENAPGIRIEKKAAAPKRPANNAGTGGSGGGGRSAQPTARDSNNKDSLGRQQQQQQQPRNNNGRNQANGSTMHAAAPTVGVARHPQNHRTDSSRKRPKQDSESAPKRPKEDRQQQQQPAARKRSSSGGPKSRGSGNGQRWESSENYNRGEN